MNKRRLVLCTITTLLVLSSTSPPVASAPEPSDIQLPAPISNKHYRLVKNWDFAKNVLSVDDLRKDFYTRYASQSGTLDHLHDEWEVYRDNDNHEISAGALHLIAHVPSNELKVGSIESGMIRSKWVTRYGYFEARMKVPKGRGMWPAFWFATEDWPPEIDVVEIVNNGKWNTTKNSFHGVHGQPSTHTVYSRIGKDGYVPGFDYADGYHTFAIEWTPTLVKHYVDNLLVVETEFEWKHNDGKQADMTPLIINLGVGAPWTGAPTDIAEFPASLDVAYIRVWQLDQ